MGARLSKKLTVSQMRSLRNIVDNPALPAVLGRLQPKTLVRLIDRVGLNDAAELMALVPVPKLLRALDEAVWKSSRPGANLVFDPAEFINWLQVWSELGEAFVAERHMLQRSCRDPKARPALKFPALPSARFP